MNSNKKLQVETWLLHKVSEAEAVAEKTKIPNYRLLLSKKVSNSTAILQHNAILFFRKERKWRVALLNPCIFILLLYFVPVVRSGAARVDKMIVRLLFVLFVFRVGEEPRLQKKKRNVLF